MQEGVNDGVSFSSLRSEHRSHEKVQALTDKKVSKNRTDYAPKDSPSHAEGTALTIEIYWGFMRIIIKTKKQSEKLCFLVIRAGFKPATF